jgi:hypothetical protein
MHRCPRADPLGRAQVTVYDDGISGDYEPSAGPAGFYSVAPWQNETFKLVG